MPRNRRISLLLLLSFTLVLCLPPGNSSAQKASRLEIGQWRDALKNIKATLKDNYYDQDLRGIDIDARFKLAEEQMKNAESANQLVGIAAQLLLDLDDSHTVLVPPAPFSHVDYGWVMRAVGSDCYVLSVKPGTDAEAKGLQAGDKVLSIDDRPMDRSKAWIAGYFYNILKPQSSMKLLIEKPDKRQLEVVIKTKLRESSKFYTNRERLLERIDAEIYPHEYDRFHELSDEVLIWKMPDFITDETALAVRAERLKKRKAVILDLRGNRGGYQEILEHFTGYFFDSNIKLSELRGRNKTKSSIAKSRKKNAFKGKVIVLIDAASRSETEIFARIMQLEKRGVVIGDRSGGSVIQSKLHIIRHGGYDEMTYGLIVAEADVIMPDGKRLEHVGVMPDELLLPTPQEMNGNLDPVLARAAELAGVKLDPKKAGELFPIQWQTSSPLRRLFTSKMED